MRVTPGGLASALAVGIAASAAQGQSVAFAGCTFAAFDATAPTAACGTIQSATRPPLTPPTPPARP